MQNKIKVNRQKPMQKDYLEKATKMSSKLKGSIMDPYLFQPKQSMQPKNQVPSMMNSYLSQPQQSMQPKPQGPSMMDPYLFQPQRQAMQITPRYNRPPADLGVRYLARNINQKAAPIRHAAANADLGIHKAIHKFRESRTPKGQIRRVQEKMQDIKDRENLSNLRKQLAKDKAELDKQKREERDEFISDVKQKLLGRKKFISEGGNKSVYEK